MSVRSDHLDWCRIRALEYLDIGRPDLAFVSFVSDLSKIPPEADETTPDGSIRWASSAADFAPEGTAAVLMARQTGDSSRLRQLIEEFQ